MSWQADASSRFGGGECLPTHRLGCGSIMALRSVPSNCPITGVLVRYLGDEIPRIARKFMYTHQSFFSPRLEQLVTTPAPFATYRISGC